VNCHCSQPFRPSGREGQHDHGCVGKKDMPGEERWHFSGQHQMVPMTHLGIPSRRKWRRIIGNQVIVLCAFIILTLVLTYPTVRCLSRCVTNSGDPLLNAWIVAWQVHKLTTDRSHFFNANIFYPHSNTLAYSESQLANALLAMPVLLVSHNPILAHNWVFLFSFAASGFGMYLLVRHLTGSAMAGLVSGIVFAFCPYRIAHLSQLQMLATEWMPLALLFLHKALRRQKWLDFLAFTLFFNLQALSSYYYALFFTVAISILLLLYLLMARGKLWSKKLTLQFGCCGLLTLLVNLPLAMPYFRLSQMGFVRSRESTQLFQAALTDYLTTTPESWFYGSLTASLRGRYWSEHASFPGILAFILGSLSVAYFILPAVHRFYRRAARGEGARSRSSPVSGVLAYAYVLVISIVLAMGVLWELPGTNVRLPLPFGWLFGHIPGFQALRVPSRFNVISMLALAVLSGYGVSILQDCLRRKPSTLRMTFHAILPLLVAVEYLAIPLPQAAVAPPKLPAVYGWLGSVEKEAVIIELPFPFTVEGSPDWAALPYVEGWRDYFSTFHWRSMVNGYSGFMPPGHDELIRDMLSFPSRRSITRLNEIGITYIVLHRNMLPPEQRAEVERKLGRFSCEIIPVREFGDALVLQLLPQGGQEVRALLATTTFDGKMALIGFGVSPHRLRTGDRFKLSLLWRAVGKMEDDYTVFTHLLDAEGHFLGQHDSQPQGGQAPTSTWHQGEVIRDEHDLTVSSNVSADVGYIVVGVYSLPTMERLPLLDEKGQVVDDKVVLMQLQITER
jgi:hypothetical protein